MKERDIRMIRALVADGCGVVAVAIDYGVTHQHVSNICRRKRWRHL